MIKVIIISHVINNYESILFKIYQILRLYLGSYSLRNTRGAHGQTPIEVSLNTKTDLARSKGNNKNVFVYAPADSQSLVGCLRATAARPDVSSFFSAVWN